MRIVDCCVHPIQSANELELFSLNEESLSISLSTLTTNMASSQVSKALLTLFDTNFDASFPFANSQIFAYCSLADFTRQDSFERLQILVSRGIKAVMFHPYLQNLTREKWSAAVAFAREAQKLGLFLCVCTAYGSERIYDIEVLPFAKVIVESVDCPVVFSHGGGRQVLDAMLIADKYPNTFLETSFSLSYWLGSSVETDFAFAMRKLGAHRWLYGSDSPFITMEKALADHLFFFERHHFKDSEIERIMSGNACEKLGL